MTDKTLFTIITIVLFGHGIGHLMGVIPALGLFSTADSSATGWLKNWSSVSWLLTDSLGDKPARIICGLLFAAGFFGFIGDY